MGEKRKYEKKMLSSLPFTEKKERMPRIFEDTVRRLGNIVVSSDVFQNDILVMHYDHDYATRNDRAGRIYQHYLRAPSRMNALLFIGVTSGSMELQVDYVNYSISDYGLMVILPTHITQMKRISPDLKAWLLMISTSYLDTLSQSKKKHPSTLISYMQLKKHPLKQFDSERFQQIGKSLDFLCEKIRQPAHFFYQGLVNMALHLFLMDLGDIYLDKQKTLHPPTLSRKEELFADFLDLLSTHCKEQHEVSFYANKLCITSQYLSLVLKEQSGKSASRWIQDALMLEAKILLKAPRASVQQVADELYFPDQSTFGKFFKKHEGLSPIAFRRQGVPLFKDKI